MDEPAAIDRKKAPGLADLGLVSAVPLNEAQLLSRKLRLHLARHGQRARCGNPQRAGPVVLGWRLLGPAKRRFPGRSPSRPRPQAPDRGGISRPIRARI